MMSEKRFTLNTNDKGVILIPNSILRDGKEMSEREVVDKLNEQQATIEKQELRLQCLEELLELSENLNKSYREKLIDMNLKMMRNDDE